MGGYTVGSKIDILIQEKQDDLILLEPVGNEDKLVAHDPDHKLIWFVDDNDVVWYNAPCSTTLDEHDKNIKKELKFTFL